MNALVTGSKGFVGRHMVRALEERGYDVVGMDIADGSGDVRYALPMIRFDLVVHCAFNVGGRAAINTKKHYLEQNLHIDATIFEWANIVMRPGRILYFSSSAAYPVQFQTSGAVHKLDEGLIGFAPVGPDADYGWAKLTGERLARNYAATGGVVHVLRPFSGYGKDQSLDYPFPTFVARAKRGQVPFEVWGDPTSHRDWVHIDDIVACSLAVIDQDYREPLNVCTGRGTTFAELAKLCMKQAGYEADIKPIDGPQGVHTRVGDPTNMLKVYTPKVSLEEGIRRAFE